MGSNVEIKARVPDVDELERRAFAIADGEPETIDQRDTFFEVTDGRLKLRDFGNGRGELIFYERPDVAGPTASRYSIAPTTDPETLRAVLSSALGVRGEVVKRRRLFLTGRTRIHVDRVDGLGDFMELEVVLRDGQDATEGRQTAESLMEQLGVREIDLVEPAYIDLIEESQR